VKWKNFDILIIAIVILLGLGAASIVLFRIIETLRGFLNFILFVFLYGLGGKL